MAGRGTLFLVVGPSGAGKDALIAAARAALAHDPNFLFPRRLITRPAEAGGEDHIALSPAAFEAAAAEGAFSLHWRSHGLGYGISKQLETALAAGRNVVVNVSRSVVGEALKRLQPVKIILVMAPVPVLAERLAARGRESAAEIAERLARASYAEPSGPDVIRIENAGALAEAVAAFLAALRAGG
ncbi:MAG TPA: phosphonate metabolism protein/1,5-bisphosphokinase (PRPP-forming) PhnN [Alphaproteobacteria bacterium]|nr:phosphonate metabolism protein/1,5-bisphosphokinase (PRPP-forming) PhnN [Alphaproteobacteria bacterium]